MEQIILNNHEKELLLLTKDQHKYVDENYDGPIELLQLYYEDNFGIDPYENYHTFLSVIFKKLFQLYMKVRYWEGDKNGDLIELFNVVFGYSKTIVRNQNLPSERAIEELFGMLQTIKVREKDENGNYINRINIDSIYPDKITFKTSYSSTNICKEHQIIK